MLQVFILFILWNTIVGLHYWAAKQLTANLSERKFIEVMTTPFLFRKRRAMNKTEYQIILIGFPVFVVSVFLYDKLFSFVQNILFTTPDSLITFRVINVFVVIPLALATSSLITLYISSQNISEDDKWTRQPEHWHALNTAKRWKFKGLFFATIMEFIFIFSITDYTIINDNGVYDSSFSQLTPTHYTFDSIASIQIILEGLQPSIYLNTKDNKKVLLYSLIEVDKLPDVNQLINIFKKNKVYFVCDQLSFLDKPKLKKQYGKSQANEIISFFNSFTLLNQNAHGIIPLGTTTSFDGVSYTIDSIKTGFNFERKQEWQWLLSLTKEKKDTTFLLLHLTIDNQTPDTMYLGTLSSLYVLNKKTEHKHKASMFGPVDEIETKIPPFQTNKGSLIFEIPKRGDFQMIYRPHLLDDIYLTFEIGNFTD